MTRRSHARRLRVLEQKRGSTLERHPCDVSPSLSRAIRRLRAESPRALRLVQRIFLRHEERGAPTDEEGHYVVEVTDEERVAYSWLQELIAEEEEKTIAPGTPRVGGGENA